jgi:glycosyltransferase involved in cell wall biosynthesis
MKVAAYTGGGRLDPSARHRVRQYVGPLAARSVLVTEYPLPYGCAQPDQRVLLPFWGAATIASRLTSLAAGHAADATWVSRQLLPTYLSIEALLKRPAVLDVDDAIWLNRGGNRVPRLARFVQTVVCGNRFLADKFREWNANIAVIPTAIDTDFYQPGNAAGDGIGGVVIGWMGTSRNFPYLSLAEPALAQILDRYKDVRVLIVADKPPRLSALPPSRLEFVNWTPSAEQRALTRMSIGLMPLEDSEWARGKCSYKMLCYMAASLPVLVSPVGMNNEVLAQGMIGYGASSTEDWVKSLAVLIEDPALRIEMGRTGRRVVESRYSLETLAAAYSDVFHSLS